MAMLERTHKQKIITSTCVAVFLGTIVLFAGVLISHASKLSDNSGSEQGSIASIKLFDLYKVPASSGGYSAGIHISVGGILSLLTLGSVVALIVIIFRLRFVSHQSDV